MGVDPSVIVADIKSKQGAIDNEWADRAQAKKESSIVNGLYQDYTLAGLVAANDSGNMGDIPFLSADSAMLSKEDIKSYAKMQLSTLGYKITENGLEKMSQIEMTAIKYPHFQQLQQNEINNDYQSAVKNLDFSGDSPTVSNWPNHTQNIEAINNLKTAQDMTRSNENYKKDGVGTFGKEYPTHCSEATYDIIQGTGADLNAFLGDYGNDKDFSYPPKGAGINRWNIKASDAVRQMAKQAELGLINEISEPEEAQGLANEGYTVVAGWINPTGADGHVATVRPMIGNDREDYNSDLGPIVSNVGIKNDIFYVKDAFESGFKNKQIKYYYNPNQNYKWDKSKINRNFGK